MNIRIIRFIISLTVAVATGCFQPPAAEAASCADTVSADVVAIDQFLMFNRLGAHNPVGMIFALRDDVVHKSGPQAGKSEAVSGVALQAGNVRLRDDKRPRPITLRVNEGDCLQINFQNLVSATPGQIVLPPGEGGAAVDQQPATRSVGIAVQGVSFVNSITDGGVNVGQNAPGYVSPGGNFVYKVRGEHEGAYELRSLADNNSGEAGQGTSSLGLFGVVHVEPQSSEWYRNQVTNAELVLATTGFTADNHPIINYDATYPVGHRLAGKPILRIVDPLTKKFVHNDLNAIITGPNHGDFPTGTYMKNPAYPDRDRSFREFTVVFHDEAEVIQPFPIFRDPAFQFTLNGVKDGFMINYGSGAVGTEVVANRLGVGPTWDCPECKFEEFFLTSWAVSDPALLVDVPANTTDANGTLITGPKASKALYPDDPSNVFHTYIGDRTKIRNLHVGKEFHIFHLHAQQWLFTPNDDGGTYLDAQGIGPGSSYTYEMVYNSGNRNLEQGDAIFHCHFYPHFAQGMWALYRNHDVFEAGTQLDAQGYPKADARALPDGEIEKGTPIPAIVPIPTRPMAPMPGKVHIASGAGTGYNGGQIVYDEPDTNAGYPFNLGMKGGHRPASPAMDISDDGGLPRHIVRGNGIPGGGADVTSVVTPLDFSKEILRADADIIPETGNRAERAGMAYHAQALHATFLPDGTGAFFKTNGLPPAPGAPFADPCRGEDGRSTGSPRVYKAANIQFDLKLNKLGHHFPQSRIITLWGDAQDTVSGTRPPEPFFIRANTGDCVNFYHTNLVPSVYEQDDFQVRTPTDIIGQHIHLVKFDVTSSDGSANGFNYEDGTMSPDEVRERIHAINQKGGLLLEDGSRQILSAKAHPYFGSTFNGRDITGARTSVQRWYVDPLLNNKGEDRTLGNVFTHDHFGPSTHQQAGLYATFITEPQGSRWRNPESGQFYGGRFDGGPTSWRADIITANTADSFREFMMQTADFTISYEAGACNTVPCSNPSKAINAPGRAEVGLPFLVGKPQICPNGSPPPCPTAISANDDGTYVINYRNEPVGHRVRDPNTNTQAAGEAGDLAHAFSSQVIRANPLLNQQPSFYPSLTANVGPRDPFTPLLQAYERDKVRVRIQTGATEESHNATIHGLKWLQEFGAPNSGYRNSQHLGISEQFILDMPVIPDKGQTSPKADYLYSLNSSSEGIWSGSWGILRSYASRQPGLLPLPNNPVGTTPNQVVNDAEFNGVCPAAAPVRSYDVTAVYAQTALPGGKLVYNQRTANNGPLNDPHGIIYARTADLDPATGKLAAGVPVEPLVLRAAAGDCIEVTLRNRLPVVISELPGFVSTQPFIENFNLNQVRTSSAVGLHPQLVEYDVTRADGSKVGQNPDQTVTPGTVKTYRWYAGNIKVVNNRRVATPVEFGATGLMSPDRIKHAARGALGALIIEPQGSSWTEDYPTADAVAVPNDQRPSRTSATVTLADNSIFREQVLVFQDDIAMRFGDNSAVPTVFGMEDAEDTGVKAINYRSEPIWFRLGINPESRPAQVRQVDFSNVLSNSLVGGDPETPVFTTKAGQPLRLRLVYPGGHTRNHVFSLYGHNWQREPYTANSTRIGLNPKSFWRGSQDQGGPTSHWDLVPEFGAGSAFGVKGDYLYRDMLPLHYNNGIWGILRVE